MATGDKLVTLDGLKAVHDHDAAELGVLKRAITIVSNTASLLSDGVELLEDSLSDRTATSAGVTYEMTGNDVYANGTTSGQGVFNMYSSTNPDWMIGGEKYIVHVENETILKIQFQAKTTTQTTLYTWIELQQSGDYVITIPDGINTLRLRLYINDTGTVINGHVVIGIYKSIASKELADDITEILEETEEIPVIKANYFELATDYCPVIPDNTDLDTYTTPGTYKITNTAHANTMINIPLKMAGKLIVLSLSQTARAYQIYATVNSRCATYVRFYNGSVWSSWNTINYKPYCYIKYSSGNFDSGKATEALDIYLPATSGYIKYVLYHYINTATDQNYNVWRIYHVYHVSDLADSNLLDISISGEWECALHLAGRDDFSGGSTHGDEVMLEDIVALKNGVPIDITTLTNITAFYDFTLVRTSKLYDPADHTTIIADHGVQYKFGISGLTINQSVIWRVADTLANCFLCMFLPSKDVIDRAVANSDFKTLVLPSSTAERLTTITKSNAKAVTMWDTSTGVSAEISVPVYPTGLTDGDQISISDNGGNDYNKLYFKVCGGGTTTVKEMWQSTSVYKIDFV